VKPDNTRGPAICLSCGAKVVYVQNGKEWVPMDYLSESRHVCVVRKP